MVTVNGGIANIATTLLHERVSVAGMTPMSGYGISVNGCRAIDSIGKYGEREHLVASFV